MIKLVSLFSDQKEADEAVKALADADLGNPDIRVLNEWTPELERKFQLLPVSNPASGISGAIGPRSRSGEILDDDDMGDPAEFFKRSVERGGVIVAVDVSNDAYRKRAESILDNQNAVAVSVAT
jgi:hypothetical protein